jgi:two-component system, OmpR family, response regulator
VSAAEGGVRRILVVDDHAEVGELIQTYLTECGYAVDRATDAASGRHLLARGRYDAAVLDVLMPGDGGLALAALARQHGAQVLLISGDTAPVAPARSPYRFLSKPFRFSQLETAVASLLGKR